MDNTREKLIELSYNFYLGYNGYRGKWIKGKYPGEYTCSRCGMEYCEADPADKPFNYCPECGSKNE